MYPIDYCVIVINEVKPFVQLQFESLIKYIPGNKPFDLFKSFHIIDKETKDGVIDYCRKRIPFVNIHPLDHYIPETRKIDLGSVWQWDFAYSYQYAVENCGDSDWILICHPDIWYLNPKAFFEELYGLITFDVGVLWNVGFFLVRREAYYQSHLGFWPLFGAVCNFNDSDRNNGLLTYIYDERRKIYKNTVNIMGLEALDLFFIEMQTLGWKSVLLPYKLRDYFDHASGSTRHDRDDSLEGQKLWDEKLKLVRSHLTQYGVIS